MKSIYFTRHARRRMKWRNISEEEVKETIARPEKIEGLSEQKINAFKSMGKELIRVTYLEQNNRIVVISVVDKNK